MSFADLESSSEIQDAAIADFLARSWSYLTLAEIPPARRASATQSAPEGKHRPTRATSKSRPQRRAHLGDLYRDLLSTVTGRSPQTY